jgi:predicted nucleic acid-binding protein
VALLRRRAQLVAPITPIRLSRDPADDKFLECAVAARADCLVSEDADLLTLGTVQDIPILDVPTFWARLSAASMGEPGDVW